MAQLAPDALFGLNFASTGSGNAHTHATPAAFYAHSPERDWEADADIPESERTGGCTDIAAQLIAYPFDVAFGGGAAPFYGTARGGKRLDQAADLPKRWAAASGGTVVTTRGEMQTAASDKPLLGLFAQSHMTYVLGDGMWTRCT